MEDIIGTAKTRETREKTAAEFGIQTMEKNADAAARADVLVLAVKPQFLEEVIREIKDVTKPDTLVISVAARTATPS
jgi:pyrroline-5-carboxylate reductase